MRNFLRFFLFGLVGSLHFVTFAALPPCSLTVDAGPDKVMCDGSSTQLNAVASSGQAPYTYSWTPAASLNNSGVQDPVAFPSTTTAYVVTVTDANSCTATDTVMITVVPSGDMVTNGNFETSANPLLRGQLSNSSGWQAGTGSPDLFDYFYNACQLPVVHIDICNLSPLDINCIGIPCNHFGYQDTRLSNTYFYTGLWAGVGATHIRTANPATDTRLDVAVEAMEVMLNTALIPGAKYRLTFYAVRAEKGEADSLIKAPYATYKVKLATSFVENILYQPINAARIASGNITDQNNWQKIETVFTADSAYTHLIIESGIDPLLLVRNNLSDPINTLDVYVNTNGIEAYFFVDDISLEYECESQTILLAEAGPDKKICKGDSVTIGGSPAAIAGTPGYTYYWSPAGSVTDPYSANPQAFPLATTTYTLQVTDINGLTSTDNVTVYVSDMSFDAGPASYTVCSGTSTQIGGLATGGISPYSYAWIPAVGLSDDSIAQPYASPAVDTMYHVTVSDAAGCTRKDSVDFTVIASPVASTRSDTTVCSGRTVFLKGTKTGGLSPYIISWKEAGGSFLTHADSVYVNPYFSTTYVYEVEDARGCFGRDSVTVFTHSLPEMNVSDRAKCPDAPAVLIGDTADSGHPPYTYSWSHGLGNSPAHMVNPPSTTTYSVSVTDSFGCVSSGYSITVTVYPPAAANAGRDKTICLNGSTTIGGFHTGSGEGGFSYLWSPPTGLNDPASATPTASPVTTTTYIVTVTNSNGCQARDTMILTVNPLCMGGGEQPGGGPGCGPHPEADAGPDKNGCGYDSVQIGGNPTAYSGKTPYTYLWTPSTGLSSATAANPFVKNISRQTYRLTVTDACGRKAVDIVTVTMRTVDVNAGPDQNMCSNSPASIGSPATSGFPPYGYVWSASSGTAPTGSPPVGVAPAINTTYTVTVTDAAGCVDKDTVSVSVLPAPSVNAGPDVSICSGGPGTTIGHKATGDTGAYGYSWYPSRGLNSTTDSVVNAKPFVTTGYTVTVTAPNQCRASDDVIVTVNESPYINAGSDKTICNGESVTIGNLAQLGSPPYTYSWSPAAALSDDSIAQPVANPSATTTYIVTVIDANGCTGKDTVVVTVKSTPVANAGPDQAVCQGKCTTIGITATGGVPPLSYSWNPPWGLDTATKATPKACPAANTIYIVTVTGSNQCADRDTMELQVYPTPEYVPNGDLETGIAPAMRGELEKAYLWQDATGDPDLFDQNFALCPILLLNPLCGNSPLDYNCVGVPCNHFGYQDHMNLTGIRYAGLWSAVGLKVQGQYAVDPSTSVEINETLAVEGMEVKLNYPLIPNRKYVISFRASLAEKGETGGNLPTTLPQLGTEQLLVAPSAPLVVKFSKDFVQNTLYRPVDRPIYASAVVTDSVNWVHLTDTIVPTDEYEYLIIESNPAAYRYFLFSGYQNMLSTADFMGNAVTAALPSLAFALGLDTAQPLQPFYNLQSYVYIDSISVKELCDIIPPLVIEAGMDTTICQGDAYTLGGSPTAAYGTPGYSYSWTSLPAGFTSSLPNPTVSPTSTTTYILQVSDAGTQVETDTVTVNVFIQQEYVANRDFEQGNLPLVRGEIEKATPWFKATGDADLYDSTYSCAPVPCGLSPSDYNCVDIPCNHFGHQDIRNTGVRYAGLWSLIQLNSTTPGAGTVITGTGGDDIGGGKGVSISPGAAGAQMAVEGIEIALVSALDTNTYYKLSFYISKAEKGETGTNPSQLPSVTGLDIDTKHLLVDECAGYNVKFSTDSATNTNYQPVPRTIVADGQVCDTTDWELHTHYFRPTEEYTYLIIESYPTDGAMVRLRGAGTGAGGTYTSPYASGFQSYFYIDDVSLHEVCGPLPSSLVGKPQPITAELLSEQPAIVNSQVKHIQQPAADKNNLHLHVVPNPNSGTFTLRYSLGNKAGENSRIIIYDGLGKILTQYKPDPGMPENSLKIDFREMTGEIVPGIYFVRLIQGDQSIVKKVSIIP